MGFTLREVPRGQIEEAITERTRLLRRRDPGPDFDGDCALFRSEDGRAPVCRGTCKAGRRRCRLLILAREGSRSDVYDVLVTCTCLSNKEIDDLVRRSEGGG